jgi:glutaredoxin 2
MLYPKMQLSLIKVLKKCIEKAPTVEAKKKFEDRLEKSILDFIDNAANSDQLKKLEEII